jgi:hypothetical protein
MWVWKPAGEEMILDACTWLTCRRRLEVSFASRGQNRPKNGVNTNVWSDGFCFRSNNPMKFESTF